MENIPAEVVALILEIVPDIRSLWALVRASPHVHRIFRDEYREHILHIIIAREIGPILMGEALAALRSSRFTSTQKVNGEDVEVPIRGLPKTEALEWTESYQDVINVANVSPPPEDMLLLWELHKDVKVMADLFVQETLPIFLQMMKGIGEPETELAICTLEDYSTIEKQRLFRAIYRFVIFGNLFAPSSTDVCDDEDLCEYFLCRFTIWQVEEISCINDFIRNKILLKWQEMEDNEFKRLAADPELWAADPRPNPPTSRWRADFFSKESKSRHFKDMQANFATLSIKDLVAVFEAKDVLLEELVKTRTSAYQGARSPFLDAALDVDPGAIPIVIGGVEYEFRGEVECPVEDMLAFEGDDLASANRSWFWANKSSLGDMYVSPSSPKWESDRAFEGFRRFGYVFLDYSRVENWRRGE
ncbi:uncharacterized protein BP5553_01508 [Venustampulla echinocandica]|uniref:Uncharacterized protein n=1 Tax=Venustampulla echinocandica TaxID=2656787 RepID=A0A370U168_9HELO|nr:uncharacterized protein BP5553_01508 [Venustampulla echinocandica]RDL41529.1 hypothetical protein BP5553_01508 [Venustampulla echinocandica]